MHSRAHARLLRRGGFRNAVSAAVTTGAVFLSLVDPSPSVERREWDFAATEDPAALHREVRQIVGGDPRNLAPFAERRAAVPRLTSATLTPSDVDAIERFLSAPGLPAGLEPSEWHALANQLLNCLRNLGANRAGGAERNVRIARRLLDADPSNPVLADYALQHLALDLPYAPPESRREWIARIQTEAERSNEPRAGTALLTLDRLSREDWFEPAALTKLQSDARAIAENPVASPSARAAAFALAERRGWSGFVEPALIAAADPGLHLPVRLAACRAAHAEAPERASNLLRALISPKSGEADAHRAYFAKLLESTIQQ